MARGRETYPTVREGHEMLLHRCLDCWTTHCQPASNSHERPTAPDNGFVPADRPYPHAKWCPNRGGF
jgi:hypothetical protein